MRETTSTEYGFDSAEESALEVARIAEIHRLCKQLGMASISHLERADKPEVSPTTELANNMKHEVVGQDSAVDSIVKALNREALRDENKPYCSLMFLGPTGVGKTETARALDRNLHGKKSNLIRIDCSEYQSDHEIAGLIGSPPGYVGYYDKARLSPSVVKGDKVIVLFDEIEKASGAMHKLLLQILEEGQLTMQNPSQGSTDFSKAIVIMTSNLGARETNARLDGNAVGFLPVKSQDNDLKSKQSIKKLVMDEVRRTLPPELIGRIDECIVFDRLDDDELALVLDRHVEKSNKRFANHGIQLHTTETFNKAFVADEPERKQYGGRRIVKNFDNTVVSRLSEYVSAGKIQRGRDVYVVLNDGYSKKTDDFDFEFYSAHNEELYKSYNDRRIAEARRLAQIKEAKNKKANKKPKNPSSDPKPDKK